MNRAVDPGGGAASTATDVQRELRAAADPADAAFLAGFFKSGPGEYGEGDQFLGVRVPATRRIVGRHRDLPPDEVTLLLDSPLHEDRLAGLLVLVSQFQRASAPRTRDDDVRSQLHRFYLDAVRAGRVNNWDLVDATAEYLVGEYLLDPPAATSGSERPADLLLTLAASESLWERRVAMIATFGFLKAGESGPTFLVAERLLPDQHDLIQKAVGWMLREVGKRVSREDLVAFLDEHAPRMGRTALSYATEHLDPAERARYRAMPRTPHQGMQ